MGIQQISGEWVALDELGCVSEAARRKEKIAGGAGELFRAMLCSHGLASLSSWADQRPTFYGNTGGESLLDHVCAPEALVSEIRTAGVLGGMSKRLQLIRKRGYADHLLVHVVFWYVLAHPVDAIKQDSPQQSILGDSLEAKEVKWDQDLLMRGLREGFRRHELLEEAEQVMENFLSEKGDLLDNRTADAFFTAMDCALI
jgi:hypothetical protein